MKYCANKDFNMLVKQLVHEGWAFRRGSKHGRLISPDGGPALTIPSSPSDRRALQNFRRDVRHAQQKHPIYLANAYKTERDSLGSQSRRLRSQDAKAAYYQFA